MQEINVAELRKHTKACFDAVEHGDVLHVYRKGRPVVDIVPISKSELAWKKATSRLTIPGVSISREILKD
ncbi:MAG: type II toxin-antitoxin system prevent-host-death family antitoxin [Thermodesulfobacteriota bacterium]|nr:type II toxin-antitoxin system prevent-host-death family antitoxin [Thermodesulfobacteriota bacterium]